MIIHISNDKLSSCVYRCEIPSSRAFLCGEFSILYKKFVVDRSTASRLLSVLICLFFHSKNWDQFFVRNRCSNRSGCCFYVDQHREGLRKLFNTIFKEFGKTITTIGAMTRTTRQTLVPTTTTITTPITVQQHRPQLTAPTASLSDMNTSQANPPPHYTSTTNQPSRTSAREGRKNHIVTSQN